MELCSRMFRETPMPPWSLKGIHYQRNLRKKGNLNTVSSAILNDAKPRIRAVSLTSVHETRKDHDTNQKRCRTIDNISDDDDIDYLGSTSGSFVKKPRLQSRAGSDNTVVSCDTTVEYTYLYRFLERIEKKSTSGKMSKPWMKKQYLVIDQADGHNCGIFVFMAADTLLAETFPGIMRNYHAEKYRLYVLQRILQYAKEDIPRGGNHTLAVDGHGDITDNTQHSETLTEGDIMERSYTKATKEGQVIHTVAQNHDTFVETDGAIATDKDADEYPCLHEHLSQKQLMACLLIVALAGNNLKKRLLWAVSDTGTRAERETYKRYIAWVFTIFDINGEKHTQRR
ncbi:uncharacterized protein LOC124290684 [Haliotis rubra]|uniref:uncharacterized protein LOC124290684 n=1 Tax=Haliotis rubra TaxID=36100 RepID=UPI001EE6284E|nr:uncharacterized protein LOC124290684 [Haliotis rubra]